MAEDADGNYYYDAGTINEQFDDIALVEGDGELEVETPDGVSLVSAFGAKLGAQQAAPGTDDLADGEVVLFYSDGTDSNTAAGDLGAARNNGGNIETATVLASTAWADDTNQ